MLRAALVAIIATQLACAVHPQTAAPAEAPTVRVDLPDALWVKIRLAEVAQFTALRGARPLADTPLPAGEAELRIYLRSGPRRPMIEIHRGPTGVRGEMWLWWMGVGDEDGYMFAELTSWVDCTDRRKRGDWSACRPRPRAPVDWAAALARLEALRVWSLHDQSHFVTAAEIDDQLVLVETRDGPHYRVYAWDLATFVETGPGAAEYTAANGLWDAVWAVVSAAEHPE